MDLLRRLDVHIKERPVKQTKLICWNSFVFTSKNDQWNKQNSFVRLILCSHSMENNGSELLAPWKWRCVQTHGRPVEQAKWFHKRSSCWQQKRRPVEQSKRFHNKGRVHTSNETGKWPRVYGKRHWLVSAAMVGQRNRLNGSIRSSRVLIKGQPNCSVRPSRMLKRTKGIFFHFMHLLWINGSMGPPHVLIKGQ